MLSFIVFLPIAGALLIASLPRRREDLAKWVAAATALAVLVPALIVFAAYDRNPGGFQFIDRHTWIDSDVATFKVQYLLGADGLSLAMLVLTAFLSLIAVLISWRVDLRPKEYFVWLLVLETSLLGVFTALDFILFFIFWEIELVPMYFLISIWGTGRKQYSAWKYVLFTFSGSAAILIGILTLGFSAGTFDIIQLSQMAPLQDTVIPVAAIFTFLIIGFGIKLPVIPFHTWLPDAHSDAPTAASVILAGVLLKMGGYGILRMCFSIMPEVARDASVYLAAFAAVNIVYGALVTLMQTDLKRLIAYSSVSHMGYVLLGASALGTVGLTGAAMQMFTHGLITGLLFATVGLIYDRTHTRQIGEMSGLAQRMPFLATIMVVAGLASLGLPSLAGFVSELTVFLGTYGHHEFLTVLGIIGILLSAAYILWAIQRVFWGEPAARWQSLTDAGTWWEKGSLAAMVLVILAVGIYPSVMMDMIETGVAPIALRLA
ncbi:MAG TPA: NADH-quinone oxidoreductase subunit M [Dehalococcoidia bacterium]|nr:NADH-quinone oxidoreductase subunit M [Dehalococcoidia bacterium]